MSTAIVTQPPTATLDPSIVQQVLLSGDLSKLTAEQRVSYYSRVCESVGLNPLTQPFAYLKLNGKEVLYALKAATEQLRFLHNISIDPKGFTREVIEGVYVVTAPASMPSGRSDVSTGAVPIDGLKGESRANAMMKAETKAKRRVTLSICGLGMLDETEVESIRADREPLVVTSSTVVAGPEQVTDGLGGQHCADGQLRVVKVGPPKNNGPYAYMQVILSDGREVIAKDDAKNNYGMITLLEQVCQAQEPIEIVTRRVKARGDKPDYDLVEELKRVKREDVVELTLAPEDMTF